jgi:hypothetical protein
VHVKESTSDISQAKAIAHAFISAFESIFCAPSLGMSSLILARKPPLALLYKVTLRPSVPSLCFNLYSVNAGNCVFRWMPFTKQEQARCWPKLDMLSPLAASQR